MANQFGKRIKAVVGATGAPLLQDSKGAWRTRSLFRETNITDMDPVFTLKPFDVDGVPSAKALYLEVADPTEYQFAIQALGSWEHWQRLCNDNAKWFHEYLDDWRETLEVKLRSEGIKRIGQISNGSSPGSLNASKWLAEKGWETKKRGRPSKAEIAKEKQRMLQVDQEVEADLERITLQ